MVLVEKGKVIFWQKLAAIPLIRGTMEIMSISQEISGKKKKKHGIQKGYTSIVPNGY